MEQANPWTKVVSRLSHFASDDDILAEACHTVDCGSHTPRTAKGDAPRQARLSAGQYQCKVSAIERQSDMSVLVSWCDATMCHYVDQLWTRVTARNSGHCALTGKHIRKGDPIFKPRTRGRYCPANRDEMILVTAVVP